MKTLSTFLKSMALMSAVSALTACYVVPVQPDGRPLSSAPNYVVTPDPSYAYLAQPVALSARLYPANDQAAALGPINAQVNNLRDGRGTFVANIAGEAFNGEASRVGAGLRGRASGVGNRGGYLECDYTMRNANQGTGICTLTSGARFNMHIGG